MNESKIQNYEELYAKYQRQLYLYINAMLPSPADADEVLQETNIVVWKKLDQFEAGTDFLSWAYRIAFLQASDYRRRVARRKVVLSGDVVQQLAERISDEDGFFEERRRALVDCKKKLEDEDRQLVEQCYAQGAKIAEVAERLNRKATSIYRSLRRIRELLSRCIQRAIEGAA